MMYFLVQSQRRTASWGSGEYHVRLISLQFLRGFSLGLICWVNITARHLDPGVPKQRGEGQHINARLCCASCIGVPGNRKAEMLLNPSALQRCVVGLADALGE